jgi:hypothetical protein
MSSNYRTNYVPPNQRNGQYSRPTPTTNNTNIKATVKPVKTLVLNNTNFPALNPDKKVRNTPVSKESIGLDFKKVAELANDLPETKTEPITHNEIDSGNRVEEIIDLTPFVKLQERRRIEYDSLYGTGTYDLRNDKMMYESFPEPSSESEDSETNEDEDDLMDY